MAIPYFGYRRCDRKCQLIRILMALAPWDGASPCGTACCWCFKPNPKSLLVAWTKVFQWVLTNLLHHLRTALLYWRNPTCVNVLTSTNLLYTFSMATYGSKRCINITIANPAILAVGHQQVFLDRNKCFPFPLDRLSIKNESAMKQVIQQRLRLN